MIEACRELLDFLSKTEQLDAMCAYRASRKDIKKWISAIRKQLSEQRNTKAPLEVIHSELINARVHERIGALHAEDIGPSPKEDSVRVITSSLKMLASDYHPRPKVHPKYTGVPPNPDNITYWKDQWGNNIFDTKKEKLREVALREYERRFHRKLHKAEVKRSEPIGD